MPDLLKGVLEGVLEFMYSVLCNRIAGKNIKWTNDTTEYSGTLVVSLWVDSAAIDVDAFHFVFKAVIKTLRKFKVDGRTLPMNVINSSIKLLHWEVELSFLANNHWRCSQN